MSSRNNRLAQPIALHGRTEKSRWGKTFLRGKQQRALKMRPAKRTAS